MNNANKNNKIDQFDNLRNKIIITDKCDSLYKYSDIELAAKYSKNVNNLNIFKLMIKTDYYNNSKIINKLLIFTVDYIDTTSSIDLVELLIKYDIDSNYYSYNNINYIENTIKSFDYDLVKLIIDKGANISNLNRRLDDYGYSLLYLIFCKQSLEKRQEIINLLIINGININIKDNFGQSELSKRIQNAKNTDFEFIKLLIIKGNHVNLQDSYSNTPLMTCINFTKKSLMYDIIKLLLENKPDIYIKNKKGKNILNYAKTKFGKYSDFYSLIFNYKNIINDHLCEFDVRFIYNNL